VEYWSTGVLFIPSCVQEISVVGEVTCTEDGSVEELDRVLVRLGVGDKSMSANEYAVRSIENHRILFIDIFSLL
jgi:hypothetical protein